MRRWLLSLTALLLIAAGLSRLWWITPPEALAARFEASQCQRIDVIDTGVPKPRLIAGIEDIERLDLNTLILSAHDRLDPAQPNGGIFRLDLDAIADGEARVTAFVSPDLFGGELRPHGIALDDDKTRLAVINRLRAGPVALDVLARRDAGWTLVERRVEAEFCRANDVTFLPEPSDLGVTIDRGSCGISVSDLLNISPTGRVAYFTIGKNALEYKSEPLHFPNGIVGRWVAETRADMVSEPWPEGTGPSDWPLPRLSVPVPGSPDNLTFTPDEGLTVALHPSLLRLALYRYGWSDHAPSRIARVDPETSEIEILFDDPAGALFSAATVGVLTGNRLIAGSVRDSGLLICELA